MQSILKDCFSKRAALFFVLPFLVGNAVLSLPQISHAQAATKPATLADTAYSANLVSNKLDEFEKQVVAPGSNWDCTLDANKLISTCKSKVTDTKSPLQGASISCDQYISIPGGELGSGTSASECTVSFRDGSTHIVGHAYNNVAGATNESTQQDSAGKTTGDQTTTTAAGSEDGCGLTNLGQCIVNAIGLPMLAISSFLLGIAGVLFNLVVVKTVFQFSNLIGNAPGLLLAWGILRDIGNMILLFGFIFMGLMTILDLHSFPTKKALPQLVIFAVLMNFSLLAAEAIIDTSNIFSTIMYSQANDSPCAFGGTLHATNSAGVSSSNTADANFNISEDSLNSCVNDGIAGSIMQASGLSTIFSAKSTLNVSLSVYVGLSLFAIIGAVVMFAASIMLIIRALTLTFLMVLAPLGFAGMAIPPLRKMAGKWWNSLIHQSFFAPILLLLIFISLKVSETFSATGGNAGLAGALSDPNVSTMGVILVFVLIIGFLIASLVAAKSFGAAGADYAVKTAAGIGFGTVGFVGRRTVGTLGGAAAKTVRSTRFGSTEAGRRAATFLNKATEKSFDPRASKAVQAVGKFGKLDFGKPSKAAEHGLHGIEEAEIAKRTKYAATLTMSDEEKKADARLKNEKKEVEEDWKETKGDLKKSVKEAEKKVKANDSGAREAELNTKLKEARERGDSARAGNDSLGAKVASDEAAAIEAELGALAGQKSADAANLERARAELDTATKQYDSTIKRIDKDIEMNNPQGRYAERISHQGFGGPFIGKHVNHEAAEKIRGEMKKSKSEKLLGEIKAAAEKGGASTKEAVEHVADVVEADHGDGGHGGGDHGGSGGGHH